MADMFGKMAEMQRKMAEAREALAAKTVSAEAGGGMVKVTANGALRITSLKIDPEAVDPNDLEMLEDLVIAGVNKALEAASALATQDISDAAGSMLPPGLDLSQFGL